VTTQEETRERIVRLEERSKAAKISRQEMKDDIKETKTDVKAVAITMMRLETSMENFFTELKEKRTWSRKKTGTVITGCSGLVTIMIGTFVQAMGWIG
jgi:aspartyl aminopeptidase